MPETNPYASPIQVGTVSDPEHELGIEASDLKKLWAITKDADQFWLALILCFLCSAFGALFVPAWYGVRLMQWNKFKTKYPVLLEPPRTQIQMKFVSARTKLIAGFSVGSLFLLILAFFVLILFLFRPTG